jgi:hypothetical protein
VPAGFAAVPASPAAPSPLSKVPAWCRAVRPAYQALSVAPVASSGLFRPVQQAGRKVLDPLPILASLAAPARGSEPVWEWAWEWAWAWAQPAAQLEEHLVVDFAAAAKEPQSACSSARTATSCSEEANAFDD